MNTLSQSEEWAEVGGGLPALADAERAPEFRLLCLAARRPQKAEDLAALRRIIAGAPDWPVVLAAIQRHRLANLVLAGLKACGATDVPDDVLREFKQRSTTATRWTLAQIAELGRLYRLFDEAGIRVLVLKGVALSVQLYGNPALRGSGDIDLLVHPDVVWRAGDLLAAAGYRRGLEVLPEHQRRLYQRRFKELTFFDDSTRSSIELHHRLTTNPHLLPWDFETLWRDREQVDLGGIRVATLSRDRLPLYLCVHGAHHAWERLRWLTDLAVVLREPGRLNAALSEAESAGVGAAMLNAVRLAHAWLGLPVGEAILDAAAKARTGALDRIVAYYYSNTVWHRGVPTGRRDWMRRYWLWTRLHWAMKSDLRYRGIEIANVAINPADWQKVPLPKVLFWLHPLTRPIGWMLRRLKS